MELYKVILLYFAFTIALCVVAYFFKSKQRIIFWSVGLSLLIVVSILFAVGIVHSVEWLEVNFVCSAIYIICAETLNKSVKKKKKPEIQTNIEKAKKEEVRSDEELPDGVYLVKELDTPLARKVFAKAIEQGFMKEDGHHYRWSENESKVLLAYMCGRIYCKDVPEYDERKRKYFWMDGKWSVFPDAALNNLFQTKDLSISRTNRLYAAAPHKSTEIDKMIDQCQGE